MSKSGSAPAPAAVRPVYTDPVNGMTFVDPEGGTLGPDGQAAHSGSQQLNEEIYARTQKAAADTASANQGIMDQNTANHATFLANAAKAKASATDAINQYFTSHGVDPTQYSQQISDVINRDSGHLADPGGYSAGAGSNTPTTTTTGNVSTTSPTTPATLINYNGVDPSSVYTATEGSDLFNQLQSGAQSKALQSYNALFSPSYSQTAVGDDILQPAVNSLLTSQFDPVSAQLTNAQKRGTLNDTGYQAALTAMAGDRTKAQSTISNLGQGILSKDRGDIDSYIGTGRTAAGSVPLGTSFDSSPYATHAGTMASRDIANFGGDLGNAVGKTSFTDLTSLLNAGGAVQGSTDPSATNPVGLPSAGSGDLSPSFIAQQANAKQQRGLGTQGAF